MSLFDMITLDDETRRYALWCKSWWYALEVDGEGRLLQSAQGRHPPNDAQGEVLPISTRRPGWFGNMLEVPCWGDLSQDEVMLKVEFGPNAVGERPVRDLRLRFDRAAVSGSATGKDSGALPTLRIRMRDLVEEFYVTSCYRVAADQDVIEKWIEVENLTDRPVRVEQCFSGVLPVGAGTFDLVALDGFWATETHIRRERLSFGTKILESRAGHTGALHNPFFAVHRSGRAGPDHGDVWFGALAYSGNWRLAFEARHDLFLRVFGGYNPFDFGLVLQPGERHVTPILITGFSPEGLSGASRRMHAHQRAHILPRESTGSSLRPVLYNSWEATAFDVNEENQIRLARLAASIGVELFVVDDGWFGRRSSDRAGLGDWSVRRDAFPNGLRPLMDEVTRLGMAFGLWVEPEMVNPDSDLYRAHPDWVLHYPGRPRTEQRNQLVLDLANPQVVDHLERTLGTLLKENAIRFLKWDMNRAVTEAGSVEGREMWHRRVEAVYGIMDRLRASFPGLTIESCASGGGRVDCGIMKRTDQAWASDNTDALARLAIQEGFALAYCPRYMACWVTSERNDQTGRRLPLSLRFNVAMRGALGIGSDLGDLAAGELQEYACYIAFYKSIRPLVQDGECHRLLPLDEHNVSVWQFVAADGESCVVSIIFADHRTAQTPPPAVLRGLRAEGVYRGRDDLGRELYTLRGVDLMTTGIPLYPAIDARQPLAVSYSRTIHFTMERGPS